MEYYSVTKSEVLIDAPTSINFENIMLCERIQTQKNTYCMIPSTIYEFSRKGKSTETEGRAGGGRKG